MKFIFFDKKANFINLTKNSHLFSVCKNLKYIFKNEIFDYDNLNHYISYMNKENFIFSQKTIFSIEKLIKPLMLKYISLNFYHYMKNLINIHKHKIEL